jgi:hypothetical protein
MSEILRASLADSAPPAEVVRRRLGEVLQEASMLRQLLRFAETAERARGGRAAQPRAAERKGRRRDD